MAGALGFEPRNFLIQSQAPYQLGHAPAGAGKATTVYQPPHPARPSTQAESLANMNSGACGTSGSQKEMLVPEPGRDSIFHQPPAICARSRIAVSPRWPGMDPPLGGSNPSPSSSIC